MANKNGKQRLRLDASVRALALCANEQCVPSTVCRAMAHNNGK
jgi:hypothetical protein